MTFLSKVFIVFTLCLVSHAATSGQELFHQESAESSSQKDPNALFQKTNSAPGESFLEKKHSVNFSDSKLRNISSLLFSRVLLQSASYPNGNSIAEDSLGAMITESVGGDVYRMGANAYGQLGNGASSPFDMGFPPTYIRTMRNKVPYFVGAGNDHSIVIAEVSSFAFGRNSMGQLGINNGRADSVLWPTSITALQELRVTNLAVSGDSNIALLSDGSLIGWGDNTGGQLGGVQSQQKNNEVIRPSLLGNVGSLLLQQLAMGSRHTLALSSKGVVYSWGSNLFGQLGVDDYKEGIHKQGRFDIQHLKSLKGEMILCVAAGGEHSAAIAKTGKLFLWGRNDNGQLGTGDLKLRTAPFIIEGLQNVLHVACGSAHTVAVSQSGVLYAWGKNSFGQLGVGDFKTRIVPSAIILSSSFWCDSYDFTTVSESYQDDVCVSSELQSLKLPLNRSIVKVIASERHSIAVTADQNIFVWGSNEYNQLGVGLREKVGYTFNKPVLAVSLYGKNITSLAASRSHTLVRVSREKFYIDRMLPLSGPVNGKTPVFFIGRGFTSHDAKLTCKFSRFCLPRMIENTSVCANGRVDYEMATVRYSNMRLLVFSPDILIQGNDYLLGTFNVTVYQEGVSIIPREVLEFKYFGLPTVTIAKPSRGPVEGNSRTAISGTGFDVTAATDVRCRWEIEGSKQYDTHPYSGVRMWTRGTIVDMQKINCDPTPAVPMSAITKLRVTINGQDYSASFIYYVFYRDPIINLISVPTYLLPINTQTSFSYPQLAGVTYGLISTEDSVVEVVGSGFADAQQGESKILIGTYEAFVVDRSAKYLRCLVGKQADLIPQGMTKISLNVTVSLNGQDYSRSVLSVSFFRQGFMHAISPLGGPLGVESQIQVTGSGFSSFEYYPLCRFSTNDANSSLSRVIHFNSSAIVFDDTTIYCKVPKQLQIMIPNHFNQSFNFSLTMNCQHYITTNLTYNLYAPPIIRSVVPMGAPNYGQTSVLIHGNGFLRHRERIEIRSGDSIASEAIRSLNSRFYGYTVFKFVSCVGQQDATALSDSVLRFFTSVAFANDSGTKVLRMSLNHQDFTIESDTAFSYYTQPSVVSLSPKGGAVQGGTMVNVDGVGFLAHAESITCRFGPDVVFDYTRNISLTDPLVLTTAIVLSDVKLLCPSPSRLKVESFENVGFSIALNGLDFESTGTNMFSFYRHPSILVANPAGGHTTGGNLVALIGHGFLRFQGDVRCRFGSAQVPAFSKNDRLLNCNTPPYVVGLVPIEVTLNGVDFSENSGAFFKFYTRPKVQSIFPRGGRFQIRNTDASTLISVFGTNFLAHSENVLVTFGSIAVPGQVTSDTVVMALSPKAMTAETNSESWDTVIKVSLNGQDFSEENNVTFRFFIEPDFLNFLPRGGPTGGSTIVTFKGDGFERFNDGSLTVDYGGNIVSCESKPGNTLLNEPFDPDIGAIQSMVRSDQTLFGAGYTAKYGSNTTAPTEDDAINAVLKTYVINTEIWATSDGIIAGDKCGSKLRKALVFTGISKRPVEGRYLISVPIDLSRGGVLNFQLRAGSANDTKCDAPEATDNDELYLYTKPEPVKDSSSVNSTVFSAPTFYELPEWQQITQYIISKYSGMNFQGVTTTFDRDARLVPCPLNEPCQNLRARLMFKQTNHAQGDFDNWSIDELVVSSRGGISDQQTMFCQAPPGTGFVALRISMNSQQFSLATVNGTATQYKYFQHPTLSKIHPLGGPVLGGTFVTVTGSGFSIFYDHLTTPKCRFGASIVEALVVSDVQIVCESPKSLNAEVVEIEIALNAQDFTTTTKPPMSFKYYSQPKILRAFPSQATMAGGTPIVLGGQGFKQIRMKPTCWWKRVNDPSYQLKMEGVVLNDTAVKCPSTPAVKLSEMELHRDFFIEISLNTLDSDVSQEMTCFFLVYRDPELRTVEPAWFNNEDPKPITLTGVMMRGDKDVKCGFLNLAPSAEQYGTAFASKLYRNSNEVLCLPPSFPGQKRLDSAPAKLFLSHNGMETHLASSGISIQFETLKTEFQKNLEIIASLSAAVLFVAFLYIYRRNYQKRHARFVLDVGTAWKKPSLKQALAAQREACPRRGNDMYPIWKTTAEDLGEFGVGIGLYYQFLRYMSFVFAMVAACQSVGLILNASGKAYGDRTDVDFMIKTSLGAHLTSNYNASIFGTFIDSNDLSFTLSIVDVSSTVLFLICVVRLKYDQVQSVEQIDADVITAGDYTVYVEDIPTNATDPDEFKTFFSHYGAVADVSIGLANGDLIRLFTERTLKIAGLELAVADLKISRLSSHMKIVEKIKAEIAGFDKEVSTMRQKSDFETIVAYVTFDDQKSQEACLKQYPAGFFSKVVMPTSKKFRRTYPISVSQAPEPSNIKWENLQVRGFNKNMRFFLTSIVTVLMLFLSFFVIIVLKGLKESLFQDGGAALCLEAPDVDDPNVQELTLWYLYTSSNAKYQTILACYCQKRLDVARDYCAPYLETLTRVQALSITAIVGVIAINTALTTVLNACAIFEKHHSITEEEGAIAVKVFLAQFMNTALISTIVNTDLAYYFPILQPLKDSNLLTGIHKDFTSDWFSMVGAPIVTTVLPASISPNIVLLLEWPISIVKRFLLKNRQKTQRLLNELFKGPKFMLSQRYGVMLSMMFTILLYSGSIPIMSWFAVMFFASAYWCEKAYLLRVVQRPPSYDEQLPFLAIRFLPFAALLHIGVFVWSIGRLEGEAIELPGLSSLPIPETLKLRIFKFHTVAPFVLFLANFFVLVVQPIASSIIDQVNLIRGKKDVEEENTYADEEEDLQPSFFEALENDEISGLETYNIKKNPNYKEAFQASAVGAL
jgi:alpha-tubulin suppressor-like RCC1 family protein